MEDMDDSADSSGEEHRSGLGPDDCRPKEANVSGGKSDKDAATFEHGVQTKEQGKLWEKDISGEVHKLLKEGKKPVPKRHVTFDDTPIVIKPVLPSKVDEYDILQDIKNQKANVTIGQLLHDNLNYQKQVREGWIKRRKKRFRLPAVAIKFTAIEDYGAPELFIDIDGCLIPKVSVDGGSGCNLMLESTAFDLGFTCFEPTPQVLRMADQSKVTPVGRLSGIPTRIGGQVFLLNFVILRVNSGRPFPILLGRPWLYAARVVVDWGRRVFTFGEPSQEIPWKVESALGESGESEEGYTSGDDELEEETTSAYLVGLFESLIEKDFEFAEAVPEQGEEIRDDSMPLDYASEAADQEEGLVRSLGQIDVPLTKEWV